MLSFRLIIAAAVVLAVGCTKPSDDVPWCADEQVEELPQMSGGVTWHEHVAPIVRGRCARCHSDGAIAPFELQTYDDVFAMRDAVRAAVVSREMPPWLPERCCNEFRDDFGLTDEQIATIDAWVAEGAPEGDPANAGEPLPSAGGLSRVDLEIEMARDYVPEPEPGRLDDFRCFVLDWPLEEEAYVTGINPVPGAREILHHMVIGVANEADAKPFEGISSDDGKYGFDCEGGIGGLRLTGILGGSLAGGDFPEGYGTLVKPDSKIILNVHYSMSDAAPAADRTGIQFKLDDAAREMRSMAVSNPFWGVADAMRVPAGEKDVSYGFQFNPKLFTRGSAVELRSFTPHMHYLGQRIRASIVHPDGSSTCLAEIADWEFGWEQPYWFAEPIRLEPDDEVFVECWFDNTRENQPLVDGERAPPRDIAWGTDHQDMCAAFLAFTKPP